MKVNKLMFRIEQGLLRLLRTKPHRKHQSVVRNSWYCTHLFNSVLSITFLERLRIEIIMVPLSSCFRLFNSTHNNRLDTKLSLGQAEVVTCPMPQTQLDRDFGCAAAGHGVQGVRSVPSQISR